MNSEGSGGVERTDNPLIDELIYSGRGLLLEEIQDVLLDTAESKEMLKYWLETEMVPTERGRG